MKFSGTPPATLRSSRGPSGYTQIRGMQPYSSVRCAGHVQDPNLNKKNGSYLSLPPSQSEQTPKYDPQVSARSLFPGPPKCDPQVFILFAGNLISHDFLCTKIQENIGTLLCDFRNLSSESFFHLQTAREWVKGLCLGRP